MDADSARLRDGLRPSRTKDNSRDAERIDQASEENPVSPWAVPLGGSFAGGRGNGPARAQAMLRAQSTHGNRAVMRSLSNPPAPVQRVTNPWLPSDDPAVGRRGLQAGGHRQAWTAAAGGARGAAGLGLGLGLSTHRARGFQAATPALGAARDLQLGGHRGLLGGGGPVAAAAAPSLAATSPPATSYSYTTDVGEAEEPAVAQPPAVAPASQESYSYTTDVGEVAEPASSGTSGGYAERDEPFAFPVSPATSIAPVPASTSGETKAYSYGSSASFDKPGSDIEAEAEGASSAITAPQQAMPPVPASPSIAPSQASPGGNKYNTLELVAHRDPEFAAKMGVHIPVATAELPQQIDWYGKERPAGSQVRAHEGERLIEEGWSGVHAKGPFQGKYVENLTRYLETEEARNPFRVGANRGANQLTLGTSNPAPLDTASGKGLTIGAEAGEFMYAMGGKGDIYAGDMMSNFGITDMSGEHTPSILPSGPEINKGTKALPRMEPTEHSGRMNVRMHHSSFLGGGEVAAAGTIKAEAGKIRSITNASGHYMPSALHTTQFLHQLSDEKEGLGYKLGDDVKVKLEDIKLPNPGDPDGPKRAKEMSASDLLAYKQGGVVDKYFELGKQERQKAESEREGLIGKANEAVDELHGWRALGLDMEPGRVEELGDQIAGINPQVREFAKYKEFSEGLGKGKSVAQMRRELGLDPAQAAEAASSSAVGSARSLPQQAPAAPEAEGVDSDAIAREFGLTPVAYPPKPAEETPSPEPAAQVAAPKLIYVPQPEENSAPSPKAPALATPSAGYIPTPAELTAPLQQVPTPQVHTPYGGQSGQTESSYAGAGERFGEEAPAPSSPQLVPGPAAPQTSYLMYGADTSTTAPPEPKQAEPPLNYGVYAASEAAPAAHAPTPAPQVNSSYAGQSGEMESSYAGAEERVGYKPFDDSLLR